MQTNPTNKFRDIYTSHNLIQEILTSSTAFLYFRLCRFSWPSSHFWSDINGWHQRKHISMKPCQRGLRERSASHGKTENTPFANTRLDIEQTFPHRYRSRCSCSTTRNADIRSTTNRYTNSTPIKVIGQQNAKLNLGLRREFLWPFIVADVTSTIIAQISSDTTTY